MPYVHFIPKFTMVTVIVSWTYFFILESCSFELSEAGFSVSEKVHSQMELSSVSGNPFPSGHELLVFQLKFRNRLSGTEDWKWTSDGILWMGLRNLNLDFQIKNLSVFKNKKIDFF
jgi:hypothetical protein